MLLYKIDNKTGIVNKDSYFDITLKIARILHHNVPEDELEELVRLDWEHDSALKKSDGPKGPLSKQDTREPSNSEFKSDTQRESEHKIESQTDESTPDELRVLDKQGLFDSLFELADQWTPEVEAGQ